MKPFLNQVGGASNIALTAVAMMLTVFVGMNAHRRSQMVEVAPDEASDIVQTISSEQFNKAAKTVVIVVRSTCQFCTSSMPFYAKLADAAKASGMPSVQLIAVSYEDEPTIQSYFSHHGVAAPTVISSQASVIARAKTPMVLVVDNDGMVVEALLGQLTHSEESRILRVLN